MLKRNRKWIAVLEAVVIIVLVGILARPGKDGVEDVHLSVQMDPAEEYAYMPIERLEDDEADEDRAYTPDELTDLLDTRLQLAGIHMARPYLTVLRQHGFEDAGWARSIALNLIRYRQFEILEIQISSAWLMQDHSYMIFENGYYKGGLKSAGWINRENCIRQEGDYIWFIVHHVGVTGSGIKRLEVCWFDLTSPGLPQVFSLYENSQYIAMNIGYSYDEKISSLEITEEGRVRATIQWRNEFYGDFGNLLHTGELVGYFDGYGRNYGGGGKDGNVVGLVLEFQDEIADILHNGTQEEQYGVYRLLLFIDDFTSTDPRIFQTLYDWYRESEYYGEEVL